MSGPKKIAFDLNRDSYLNALVGQPPDGWREKISGEAQRIADALNSAGVPLPSEDVLLVAALAGYADSNASPVAFVQRAKQVAKWVFGPHSSAKEIEPTSLPVLENKATELARQIAGGLFRNEGFVLLLFNEGAGGHTTWVSTIDRRDQIKIFEEHVAHLKSEQEKQS
jgi:hypothetical protein